MCHGPLSLAPPPPRPGSIRVTGAVTLAAADDAPVPAYAALPEGRERYRGRVVVLPDVRGLHPFYTALARRFAEAGFAAVAIDLYGRTAGGHLRDPEFAWRPHMPEVREAQVDADVRAALDHLDEVDRDPGGPAFTVGFCFGGGHSWRLAGSDLPLAGTIGFYGLPHLVTGELRPGRAPILMLLAGRDEETPAPAYEELTGRLDAAGARYDAHTYPEAPHSFFDRAGDRWAPACQDAWRRLLAFTDRLEPGRR